jgi:hypothetical protein
MAKIRLKKLPDGFEIKDGKVIKKMQHGGMMTGDQSDYGLVTSPYNFGNDQFNNTDDNNVRYSLSAVPREMANLEAEGGETVLTDLNNDGKFGLYNINGPRHSKGGVPMYLPEQSFVFSDTPKMKFNRQELAEFGIESRKKMTPAKVSKKYQLNEFIGAMADPFADDITVKSAELMLDKNLMSLSKLAFGQEQKKKFADGVPLASHPYLMAMGINPIEFTQQVENITAQQAAQRMFDGMNPEQQAQVMALRQMLEQSGQMPQQPMAAYGKELPKAQFGNAGTLSGLTLNGLYARNPQSGLSLYNTGTATPASMFAAPSLNGVLPGDMDSDGDGVINRFDPDPLDPNVGGILSSAPAPASAPASSPRSNSGSGSRTRSGSDANNVAFDPALVEYYKTLGIDINTLGINALKYKDIQPYERGTGYYGGAKKNQAGFFESWKGIYPDLDKMQESIKKQTTDADGGNPEVKKFQKWLNDVYIPEEVELIKQKTIDAGGTWSDNASEQLKTRLLSDYGFDPNQKGKAYDGDFGTFTSSRRPIGFEATPPPETKEGCPCEDGSYSKECCPTPKDPEYKYIPPQFDFFTQDMLKMGALAMRDRDMFLPWQPAVEIPKVDYVLEEPTRQLADVNEQFNIMSQSLGAFAGPQSLNARMSKAAGDSLRANANTFAQVHGRNIGTVNKGKAMNAQFEAVAKNEQRDRSVKLFDDTQLTLQGYMDEKNLDRETLADLTANAYTNAANAYNLSSLYDQYNIDPVMGGAIYFTNPRMWEASRSQTAMMSPEEYINLGKRLEAAGMEVSGDKMMDRILNQNTTTDPTANLRNQYTGTGYTAKKGTEIKPYALPFYTGKTGY